MKVGLQTLQSNGIEALAVFIGSRFCLMEAGSRSARVMQTMGEERCKNVGMAACADTHGHLVCHLPDPTSKVVPNGNFEQGGLPIAGEVWRAT